MSATVPLDRRQSPRHRETMCDAFIQIVEVHHAPGEEKWIDLKEGGTLYASYFDPSGILAGENDLDLRGMGPIEGHCGPVTMVHERLRQFEADGQPFRFFADWYDGRAYGGTIEFVAR